MELRERAVVSAGADDATLAFAGACLLISAGRHLWRRQFRPPGKRACNDAGATKGCDPRLARVPVGQSATLSSCGCAVASAGAREAGMASAGADTSDFVAGTTDATAIACEETRGGASAAEVGTRLARASYSSRGSVTLES